MQKPIYIHYQPFTWSYFLLITLFIIFSCSQNKPAQYGTAKKNNTLKPPVTIIAKEPVITRLDSLPPPRITAIAQTTKSPGIKTKSGQEIILPEIKPAGFSVSMQNYTSEHGLAVNSVVSGYRDKTGHLWFGTWGGGVSRFDGKSFTSYSTSQGLANNYIMSIFEDKSGNLWFGTYDGGVSRYDGRSFRSYTSSEGLAGNTVFDIIQDKTGNLWFATLGGGISRYDGKSFTSYTTAQGLVSNNTSRIKQDKSGNIWIGTWDAGVSCYKGRSFTNYTIADGLANNIVASIFEDKSGNLWLGNGEGKVSRLDGEKNPLHDVKATFKHYTIADGLANNQVQYIAEDKKGNLWFATRNGVSQLAWDQKTNPDGRNITRFTTRQGLANNHVNCILEDKSGNLWFGTDGGGVSLLERDWKSLTTLTTDQGVLNTKVTSILEDKTGNLWFATWGVGVSRYDGNSLMTFPGNSVSPLFEDKSRHLWFDTEKGLSRLDLDGKSVTRYTTAQGLPASYVSNIFEDKTGDLWFATGSGVFRLNQDSNTLISYTTAEGHISNFVTCLLRDKSGNFWFGTNAGVWRLNSDGKSFTNYTTDQGLVSNNLTSILEDKSGNLWFGTQRGLSRYDGTSFKAFTTAEGLPDDRVQTIVMDKEGVIWLGTNKGLTALKSFVQNLKNTANKSRQENFQPSNELSNHELESREIKPVFEIYNHKTGYPVEDITSNICITHDGIIWAGTTAKLVRFDYSSLQKNPNPPDVFIQSIKLNNENICWYDLDGGKEKIERNTFPANITEEVTLFGKGLSEEQRDTMRKRFSSVKFDSISRFYPVPVNLVLPYGHNNITFDFAAIEPAKPNLVHYQHMLEGYDNDWNPVTDKTSASFGNMHEGKYTFKLKAQSPDGIWSEPLIYTFKVLPPWYRSVWAYFIYGLLFITGVYGVHRFQRERLLRAERERTRERELEQAKEIEKAYNELQTTQAQLVQREKMASLGELTAGIAHEIQNPLNFVNNFSDVNTELIEELEQAANKGNIDEVKLIAGDIRENEQKINHHGKRADAIVKGMLQHSRVSTGQKEPTDINALADEYLRLSYHGFRAKDKTFNTTLHTDFNAGIEKINIVPQDIGRVLLNLYNNAFYAVTEKKKQQPKNYEPTVTVTTKAIKLSPGNDGLEISVKDNGVGISQKVLDKIFQPFFTTKPTGQGTGLGLSLSYDIIKAHEGEIKVETKEGDSAEFIIQLPNT